MLDKNPILKLWKLICGIFYKGVQKPLPDENFVPCSTLKTADHTTDANPFRAYINIELEDLSYDQLDDDEKLLALIKKISHQRGMAPYPPERALHLP